MDVRTLIQLATLVSVIIGVISLLISVRSYRRQVNAQFLLEYTKRVDDIILSLPAGVWAVHLSTAQEPPPPSEELTKSVLRCLGFISQVRRFSRNGYMPASVWKINRLTFARMLSSPLFVREWKNLAAFFAADEAFCRYVERAQRGSPDVPRSVRTRLGTSLRRRGND